MNNRFVVQKCGLIRRGYCEVSKYEQYDGKKSSALGRIFWAL